MNDVPNSSRVNPTLELESVLEARDIANARREALQLVLMITLDDLPGGERARALIRSLVHLNEVADRNATEALRLVMSRQSPPNRLRPGLCPACAARAARFRIWACWVPPAGPWVADAVVRPAPLLLR